MNFDNVTVKYSEIKQDAHLAELYSKIYTIPKTERVKVLMSWMANAYSDLLIPFLPQSDALTAFTVHVRLLDTFCNNSSYEIVAQLASEFSDTFLISQVIPNLLENHDKTAEVTYYIQIICENLTCPSLIRKIMDVVTTKLTPIFITRLTSDNHLVVSSTLSLIKALLEFYCEDFWYDLILQYLLPMKHLLTSQRQKLIPEIEFHESTQKILELIPGYVTQTTSPSLLAEHFILYYKDETMRLRVIDTAVSNSLPSSQSDLQRVGLGLSEEGDGTTGDRKPGKNQTYPMWIFRYDGTDFLHALRNRFFYEEPEEFFEDDLFSETNQLDQSASTSAGGMVVGEDDEGNESGDDVADDVLSRSSVNISNGENERSNLLDILNENSPKLSLVLDDLQESFVKDKKKSIDNLEVGNSSSAYFGPFLQTLFNILEQWTTLEPDVLFTATEVVSVLASSRIPLINSIFLDLTLTLQPSYPNFSNLLHSLKTKLDELLKTYPDYIFRTAWKAAAKDCSTAEFHAKDGSNTRNGEESSFVGTLRKSISRNKSLQMAAEEVQRSMGIGRRGSSFSKAFANIFKSPSNSDRVSEFRLLNRAAAHFESEEEENSAKVMALRSILFTHWMLELGAIAMQLSWGRRPIHLLKNSNYANDDDADVADYETTAESNNEDEFSTFNANSQ